MESDETGPPTRFGWLPPLHGLVSDVEIRIHQGVYGSVGMMKCQRLTIFPILGNKVTYELPLYLPNSTNLICILYMAQGFTCWSWYVYRAYTYTYVSSSEGSHASEASTFSSGGEEGGESEDDSQASPATWTFPSGWTSGLRESPIGDLRRWPKKQKNPGKCGKWFKCSHPRWELETWKLGQVSTEEWWWERG